MAILDVAHSLGYLKDDAHNELNREIDELAAMLYKLIGTIGS